MRRICGLPLPYLARRAIPTTADIVAMLTGSGGILWDPTDKANLYQTNDTSTPVTASGQTVGRVVDLLSGYHFLQSSSSLRPLYTEDDGFGAVVFDGTDDRMGFTSGSGLGIARNRAYMTMICAAKPSAAGGLDRIMYAATINANQGNARVSIECNASNRLTVLGRRTDSNSKFLTSTATINGAWGVFTGRVDWENTLLACQINRNPAETSIPAWDAGTASDDTNSAAVVFGGRRTDSATGVYIGALGRGVFVPVRLSTDVENAIIRWAAAGAGLSL